MLVDREDGAGEGFNGVLPAAQNKEGQTCEVVCDKNDDKNCQVVCTGIVTDEDDADSADNMNKNQCENGRNKCSENAVCKDLEDELSDDGISVGK